MPTVSTALETSNSWHYEINTRLTDTDALATVHVDQNGQLYIEKPTASCTDDIESRPLLVYINGWSLETTCDSLVYLSQPLTLVNSSCLADDDSGVTKFGSGSGANYHGLVCARNRTEWCQRGYKETVYWPLALGQTCDIRRTGVDKSRCYSSGR